MIHLPSSIAPVLLHRPISSSRAPPSLSARRDLPFSLRRRLDRSGRSRVVRRDGGRVTGSPIPYPTCSRFLRRHRNTSEFAKCFFPIRYDQRDPSLEIRSLPFGRNCRRPGHEFSALTPPGRQLFRSLIVAHTPGRSSSHRDYATLVFMLGRLQFASGRHHGG